jgi:hypothetical protein
MASLKDDGIEIGIIVFALIFAFYELNKALDQTEAVAGTIEQKIQTAIGTSLGATSIFAGLLAAVLAFLDFPIIVPILLAFGSLTAAYSLNSSTEAAQGCPAETLSFNTPTSGGNPCSTSQLVKCYTCPGSAPCVGSALVNGPQCPL